MSVILYDMEKFNEIHDYIEQERDKGFIFSLPIGALIGDTHAVKEFINDLYQLNQTAFNVRYNTKEKRPQYVFNKPKRTYANDYEIVKSLRSIHYNTIEAEEEEPTKYRCKTEILEKLINAINTRIVTTNPEYDKADTW